MTSVATSADRTIIDWSTFSIGAGEAVSFAQPSAASAVLNRVTGGTISDIQGALRSNGEVFLLNPNGVIIGRDAVIDAAGFVASTLSVDAGDFLDGGDMTFVGDSDAAIHNLGEIIAQRGDIVLIARHIENAGTLSAHQGDVALAAGGEVLLAHEGEKRIFVRAPAQGDVSIENTGAIEGVRAEIAAHGGNIYSLAINNEGVVRGSAVEVGARGAVRITAAGGDPDRAAINLGGEVRADGPDGGGVIEVDAGAAGTVWADGRVAAAGAGDGERGGEVSITGRRVALTDKAVVDASGAQGGGRIRIGGGLQGGDADLRNAEQTYVGEDVNIAANAVDNGAGGEAIVWADGATQFYGHVDVSGGAAGGDGGFTEVSGKQYLDFQGTADLSARAGFTSGEILLDPTDITISNAPSAPASSGPPSVFSYTGGTSVLNVADLEALFTSGDVTVTTNGPGVAPGGGDITIDTTITVANGRRLTLIADDDIISSVAAPFALGTSGGEAFLTLQAGGDIGSLTNRVFVETVDTPNLSTITATGDNVYLAFGGPITMAGIEATNGDVDILNVSTSNNRLLQTGDIIATGNITIDSSAVSVLNQGHRMDAGANPVIRSTGGGDIDIITSPGGGIEITRIETTGGVSISNSGNIASIADVSVGDATPNIIAGSLSIDGYFRTGSEDLDIETPLFDVNISPIGPNSSIMAFENSFAGDVTLTNYTGAANVNYRQTGGGALNITGPVSTTTSFFGGLDPSENPGDITIATGGDININADITALDDVSFTAGGALNIGRAVSATNGNVSLAGAGDVRLSVLPSSANFGSLTIMSNADIIVDAFIVVLDSFTLDADGDIRTEGAGLLLFDVNRDETLTLEAGGDIGSAGAPLSLDSTYFAAPPRNRITIIGADNAYLFLAAGSLSLDSISVNDRFSFVKTGFGTIRQTGDIIAGGDIRIDMDANTSDSAFVMDGGVNTVMRSTGGDITLAGIGGDVRITRLEALAGEVLLSGRSSSNRFTDVYDATPGDSAADVNIAANRVRFFGLIGSDLSEDIDISAPQIDIFSFEPGLFVENQFAGDVTAINLRHAGGLNYRQTGGGSLIASGDNRAGNATFGVLGDFVITVVGGGAQFSMPITLEQPGDVNITADGDIAFSAINIATSGSVTLNSTGGDILDISGGGLANITADNAFLTAGGAIGAPGAPITLAASIGVLNASAGGGLFVDALGALQVGAATPVSAGGDIDILAAGDLTVTNLAATTGDIRLTQTGAGALNIANVISAGGDVSLAAAGDVNIDNGNINSNAPVTALNDISVTAGGAINIRESFSAGGTALFDANGDVLLVGLSSAVIDAETTIDAGGDIRYDGFIAIRQPLTLRAAGDIFRVDEGVFGNSFFGASGFAPVLTIEAGGDIGLPGDPLVSIVGDTTLTGDNIFLRTDGGVRLNGVTAAGDFFYQNTSAVLPAQLSIFGDVIAGGDIRFDLTNTGDHSIVMDQTANPAIRSTGGGDIVFDLADAGAHRLTEIETDGAVVFRSSGSDVNSFADASAGEAANIVAGSLVLDGYFTQTGADDIDISTPEIDIVFTNAASSVTLENAIAGDVVITNFTGAADIDYTQTGGGALIVGGPVSAFGDIALTTDGDIQLTRLDAGGGLFVDSLGALQVGTGATAVSAGGDISIVAANDLTIANLAGTTGDIALTSLNGAIVSNVALSGDAISLNAADDIGSAAAPITLAAAVNTVSANGANVFLRALGDMGVNTVTATGAVRLDAAGAILDRSAGDAPQIVADTVTLNAVDGVGEDDDLDLAAQTITANNAGAGDVRLSNTSAADASATIETDAGDIDIRQSGGGDLSVLGAETLAGDIVIDVDDANLAAGALTAQSGAGAAGDILLGTGTPVDTLLTGTISAAGDIRSVSRRNLTLDSATLTAGGVIELVLDSDAARPDIGPGLFSVAGASALSAGRVDIYAAQPEQFLLGGGLTINGADIMALDLTQDADGVAFDRYFGDPAQAPGADGYLISFKNTSGPTQQDNDPTPQENGPTQQESEQIIAEVVRAANDVSLAAPSTADPLMLYDAGGRTSFGASISYAEDRQLDDLAMSLAFSSSYTLSPNRYVSIERPWLFPVERQTSDLTSIVRLLQNSADSPIDIDAAAIGENLSCESIRDIVELVDNAEAYKQYRELCGLLTASAPRSRASTWEAAQ